VRGSRRQSPTLAPAPPHRLALACAAICEGNPVKETLRSAFRKELGRGCAVAGLAVANALYNNAVHNNNVAAQIWWSKARMRWSETLGHQMLDEEGKPTARPEGKSRAKIMALAIHPYISGQPHRI
jgi:hypothetical protein